MVDTLITLQARNANAVTGLDETLQAVSDKRVERLLISDGFRTPGYVDESSGYVVANLTLSPLSESELTEVEDVIDAAVALTVAQGGHVDVIADNIDLDQAGRIGAILRY